jgi:DNA-binding HxlR family transcriptional regulator
MRKQRHVSYANCPVEAALDIIGGKWKAILLLHVIEGTKRFNELQRLVPRITQRVLTNQLRELENDGVIARTVYPQVPPKVEYSVTPFGKTIEPLLKQLVIWAETEIRPQLSASGSAKTASANGRPRA